MIDSSLLDCDQKPEERWIRCGTDEECSLSRPQFHFYLCASLLLRLFWMRRACQCLFLHKSGNHGIFVIRYAPCNIKLQVTTSCNKSGIWAVTSQPFSPPPPLPPPRFNLGRSDCAGFDEVALNDFDVGPPLIETRARDPAMLWSLVWIFCGKAVGACRHFHCLS